MVLFLRASINFSSKWDGEKVGRRQSEGRDRDTLALTPCWNPDRNPAAQLQTLTRTYRDGNDGGLERLLDPPPQVHDPRLLRARHVNELRVRPEEAVHDNPLHLSWGGEPMVVCEKTRGGGRRCVFCWIEKSETRTRHRDAGSGDRRKGKKAGSGLVILLRRSRTRQMPPPRSCCV